MPAASASWRRGDAKRRRRGEEEATPCPRVPPFLKAGNASGMITRLVKKMLRRDLRRAFRRVVWAGPPPALPDSAPVILYTNHHNFYDGHLLWLLLEELLGRPGTLWMEDWDRFPFFAAVGVQPFPPGDDREAAARRRATLRRTARRMREQPSTALVYFPEGRLHPPADGLLPFPSGAFERLARLLPEDTRWWPVALRILQTGDARPTALLAGGAPHDAPDGRERKRLRETWNALRHIAPGGAETRTLLEGARGPNDRWDLSFLAPFFERYL